MPKYDQRLQILLSEEESLLLKKEAKSRGLSQGELVRKAIENEVTRKSDYSRIQALRNLTKVLR